MKKYNTKPIDFTGCHPAIAEALKRGEAIECWVWDTGNKKHNDQQRWIGGYTQCKGYTQGVGYITLNFVEWDNAEPIPLKPRRIMPPERAIPVLIENGYAFDELGALRGEPHFIVPQMFEKMGKPLEDNSWLWPPCIIEEVSEDE